MKRAISFSVLTIVAAAFLSAAYAPPAQAGRLECRKKAARIVGKFAERRAKQIVRCRITPGCGPANLARKLENLRTNLRAKLLLKCHDVDGAMLGMGGQCPDPTGSCAQDISSADGLIECILCMAGTTLEQLLDVLHGDTAPPAQRCGGCIGSRCDDKSFCEPPPGVCGDVLDIGMCTEVPQACPDLFAPVCGCDGTTYGNDCERRSARVGLHHRGPCKHRCDSSDPCPSGTFCEGLPGLCGIVDDGVCEPVPAACPDHIDPVCGCDGTTYGNDCERRTAGVRLHHKGRCKQLCFAPQPGDPNLAILPPIGECGPGTYCEPPAGHCDASVPGECRPLPDACPQHYDPVCGCDGLTYGNNCERMVAAVGLLHKGACDKVCGGFSGRPCGEGEYCELPPTTCNHADLEGICLPIPQACTEQYDPVCGCDGVTYGNDCERMTAMVTLAHHGPCAKTCAVGGADCNATAVCLPPRGDCAATRGACVEIPRICPLTADGTAPYPLLAVCGCDGTSYSSACEAAQSGVGVEHAGACERDGQCQSDADCEAGHRCLPPPLLCTLSAAPIIAPKSCIPVPDDCTAEPADVVCGCDGQEYRTHCDAMKSGAGVGYPGPCYAIDPF